MKSRLYLPLLAAVLLAGCEKPETPEGPDGPGTPPDEEYKLPEVSDTVIEANTFNVEYFLSMDTPDKVSSHILYATGRKPLVYVYSGASYEPGKPSPVVQAALLSRSYPFFIQNAETSVSGNRGKGILTRYSVSGFDGIIFDQVYMAGPSFSVPLSTVTDIAFYTADVSTPEELKEMAQQRHARVYGDSVIFGEYLGQDAEALKSFAQGRDLGMRFDYVRAGDRIVYALVQPAFATRSLSVNGDCVTICFEKFF